MYPYVTTVDPLVDSADTTPDYLTDIIKTLVCHNDLVVYTRVFDMNSLVVSYTSCVCDVRNSMGGLAQNSDQHLSIFHINMLSPDPLSKHATTNISVQGLDIFKIQKESYS